MPESEVTAPVPALDDLGWPQNFGWARSPCFLYDPGMLRAPRGKVSESDRYVLFSSTHLVVFEIMDDGYLGYFCISVVSLNLTYSKLNKCESLENTGKTGVPMVK